MTKKSRKLLRNVVEEKKQGIASTPLKQRQIEREDKNEILRLYKKGHTTRGIWKKNYKTKYSQHAIESYITLKIIFNPEYEAVHIAALKERKEEDQKKKKMKNEKLQANMRKSRMIKKLTEMAEKISNSENELLDDVLKKNENLINDFSKQISDVLSKGKGKKRRAEEIIEKAPKKQKVHASSLPVGLKNEGN